MLAGVLSRPMSYGLRLTHRLSRALNCYRNPIESTEISRRSRARPSAHNSSPSRRTLRGSTRRCAGRHKADTEAGRTSDAHGENNDHRIVHLVHAHRARDRKQHCPNSTSRILPERCRGDRERHDQNGNEGREPRQGRSWPPPARDENPDASNPQACRSPGPMIKRISPPFFFLLTARRLPISLGISRRRRRRR